MLTLHKCINYGSYWQARCLIDALRARGIEAVVLDHHSRHVNRAEWSHGLCPVPPAGIPGADRARYALKMLRFARALAGLPRSARFRLERPTELEPFDLIVVGSDEVWNFSHPWYGGAAVFFGVGVRAERLIAYAGSFGSYDASRRLDRWWADRLRAFHALSVRDDNSRRILERALGHPPPIVADPCLLSAPEPAGRWRGPAQPFVAVYGHGFSPGFARAVRRWATARGLTLVSLGYRNGWADVQWLSAGPHDFAHGLARAAAVATNFYHGCVFALNGGKPFVCEDSSYRSLKVRGLLASVAAGERLVTDSAPAEHVGRLLERPPGEEIRGRVKRLRDRSNAFLDRATGATRA